MEEFVLWQYNYNRPFELYHYGVKGMKWGIRRTPEELKYNRTSISASMNNYFKKNKTVTVDGTTIKGISNYSANRAAERKVSAKNMISAATKPLDVEKKLRYNERGEPSRRYTGARATINVNPKTGMITTVWETGTKKRDKLLQK